MLSIDIEQLDPVIALDTALVLRSATDGRWIATYDPTTSELNLPAGLDAPLPGAALSWSDFDEAALDALTVELLGVDTTPEAEIPTWEPRGLYSDWADEHHVTPTSLILFEAPRGRWTSADGGTPGW